MLVKVKSVREKVPSKNMKKFHEVTTYKRYTKTKFNLTFLIRIKLEVVYKSTKMSMKTVKVCIRSKIIFLHLCFMNKSCINKTFSKEKNLRYM